MNGQSSMPTKRKDANTQMEINETLAYIAAQIEQLHSRESGLLEQKFKEVSRPQAKSSIGSTFVHRNGYGSGGQWHTYKKLVTVCFLQHCAWLIFERFQINSDGIPEITMSVSLSTAKSEAMLPPAGYVQCTAREYGIARRRTLSALSNPKLCIALLRSR